MKTARETRAILDLLETQHPDADTELHYKTAFQLLVATILSAQSTDVRVNMVTPALFKRYRDARALAKATAEQLGRRLVLDDDGDVLHRLLEAAGDRGERLSDETLERVSVHLFSARLVSLALCRRALSR